MLKICNENNEISDKESYHSPLKLKKQKTEAYFERLWLVDKDQFNPEANCLGRLRIERTIDLMHSYFSADGKLVADLGCGYGIFAKHLRDRGAKVDAVDIAKKALEHVANEKDILSLQQFVPYTKLDDSCYDLVISTELIAYLPREDYRLYFSELSRLLKKDAYAVCSTPIDIYSYDALQRFASLAETEFDIEKWVFSYHYLWIKLHKFLQVPLQFAKAAMDAKFRKEQIEKRKGLSRSWFWINSTFISSLIWKPVKWLVQPIFNLVNQNKKFLKNLESFSRFIWQDQAISHAVFIGKRRPLLQPPPDNLIPVERKAKKIVWE